MRNKYLISRWVAPAVLLLCLMTGAASAETKVTLSPETPRAGEKVILEISHGRTDTFSYVLMSGVRTLGSADDVTESRLGFVPEEEGDYLLRVIPSGYEEDAVYFTFTVLPAPAQETPRFILYGQKDGHWTYTAYGNSTLEISGCSIFTLNHALQRLGYSGEEISPAALAERYGSYLGAAGTRNGALIARAARDFGFTTKDILYTTHRAIREKMEQGAVFSFGIVDHHIALADGLSEDGTMCHIVDSAPSSTFRHITGATPSVYDERTGTYRPADKPTDIPGVCYCLETGDYDGAEYWLPLSYVARRGLRLILPKGRN